jgi:hypothetical protein
LTADGGRVIRYIVGWFLIGTKVASSPGRPFPKASLKLRFDKLGRAQLQGLISAFAKATADKR